MRGGQGGLSLIEVLIAITILAVSGTLLLMASRTSVTGQQRAKVYGEAATAAKEVLEGVQLLGLDSVSRLQDTPMEHSQGGTVEVRATARGVQPSDIANFAGLDTSTLRHLTLRTRFPGESGALVTKVFTTIVFKP